MENGSGGCARRCSAMASRKNIGGKRRGRKCRAIRSSTGLRSETVRCAHAPICANPVLATFLFEKTLAMKSQEGSARMFHSGAGRFFPGCSVRDKNVLSCEVKFGNAGYGNGGHGDTGCNANAEPDIGGERRSGVSGSSEAEFGVCGRVERGGGRRGACAGEIAAVAMRRSAAGPEFAGSGCAGGRGADSKAVSADRSGTARSWSDRGKGRRGGATGSGGS